MQMFWLAKDGVQQGPMPLAQAQRLIDEGQYLAHHMAWIAGTPAWCTIADIPELSAGFKPPGSPLGAQEPDATATPPPPPPPAKVPFAGALRPHSENPRPWRRYAARTLDTAILMFVLQTMFAGRLHSGMWTSSLLFGLPSVLLQVPVEMVSLEYFQTTIGKYFFGIAVRDHLGVALSRAQSLERALRVAAFGGALGIPGLGTIANFIAYLDIRRPESATWDRAVRSTILYEDGTKLRQLAGSFLLAWLSVVSLLGISLG